MTQEHAKSLLVFVIVVGVLGGLVMLALMMTWRRRLAREQALHEKQKMHRDRPDDLPDTWKVSADRVTLEPSPVSPSIDEQSVGETYTPSDEEPSDVFENVSGDDVNDDDDPAPPPMDDFLPELREHESDDDAGLDESFFSDEDQPYDPPPPKVPPPEVGDMEPPELPKPDGEDSADDEHDDDRYDDPFGRRHR